MIPLVSLLFKGWRWVDYFQLVHSIAFCCFGFLILVKLDAGASFLGYLVGGSFLFFGLYRLKFYILFFNRAYLEIRKGSPIQ
jgi:hypothetical protein